MNVFPSFLDDPSIRHRLRLQTLTRLRWMAVIGQSVTVLIVAHGYGFNMPELLCFALIACSAWLNVFLSLRFPAAHRLPPLGATGLLSFDVLQLSGLLFMTGGLANPFSVLLCVPVIISSPLQPVRHTLSLSALSVASVSVLAFYSLPLPWYPGSNFEVPYLLIAGAWIAIVSTTAFAAFYSFQVSEEANKLTDALAATELVLQREHHISALDGLAAAAAHELGTPLATIQVVAREMEKALADDTRFTDDLMLLRSQTERCRDILRRLTTLSAEDEAHMVRLPLRSLIEEVIAPHREFGIAIEVIDHETDTPEAVGRRNPAILFGLGNLIENAVDFAHSLVRVTVAHDRDRVEITIEDDGPGFAPDVLTQIGVPFMNRRNRQDRENAGGLGLGLFIAKTLLERSGAHLEFANRPAPESGAQVKISWPREKMDLFGAEKDR
ncbi:ActS/PrrB/RegB family redox-sensitive histidine kinase [Hoeflea sp. YIM 152468]|uniref:ActS/PrrB/RegB family redox-sensitive histidine kinase n=1 Tax=Hoeflea sp. YIM 152468 TaxID=3031759 RepID=UPI0023DB4083|nr:ActS/PrrB/RegB family redox-sensitive histidine kinase [Hoeflea sp. YIM 152468]MDF1610440.1 ActS/PrrB/RegB family redox-sensitive histidine kinase [Hoeflea sp. YIM 152468]